MRAAAPALFAIVQSTMTQAKSNIADAQQVLRRRDQSKLVTIAAAFQRSANDMKQTASALGVLKRNPQTRANLRESAAQLRTASANLARLSDDLGGIAKNSQTKAQLRDAGERFRALLKRL
jgi:hypothetical protein